MDSTVILPSSPTVYRSPEYLLNSTSATQSSPLIAMHSLVNHYSAMSYPDSMSSGPNSDCSGGSPQQAYPIPDLEYDFVGGNDSGFELLAAQSWDDSKALAAEYADLDHVKNHIFTLDGHYLDSNTQFNISSSNTGDSQQLEAFNIPSELELNSGVHYVTGPPAPSSSEGSDSPAYCTPPTTYIDIPSTPYTDHSQQLFLAIAPPISPISPLSLQCGSPQTPMDSHCSFDPSIASASPSHITGSPIDIGAIRFETGVKACPMPVAIQGPSEDYDSSYDSGEDEKPDEEDDDYDYIPSKSSQRRAQPYSRRNRSSPGSANSMAVADLSTHPNGVITRTIRTPRVTRIAVPIPVPNLTKKSRGRRVPTSPSVLVTNGIQKHSRSYMCQVEGCGKCFQRGEHLKRHIRSIHTNEKPHKCPDPTCGKEFSRHDNLCQHLRVHRNFSAPRDGY